MTNALEQPTQRVHAILNEEKHAAANHGVEAVVERHRGCVTDAECHILQAGGVSPLARGRQKVRIGVNTNNCTVWSYKVGDDESDVARAAPHIENLHSRQDACILEKAPRVRPKHLCLPQQPIRLRFRVPEEIRHRWIHSWAS